MQTRSVVCTILLNCARKYIRWCLLVVYRNYEQEYYTQIHRLEQADLENLERWKPCHTWWYTFCLNSEGLNNPSTRITTEISIWNSYGASLSSFAELLRKWGMCNVIVRTSLLSINSKIYHKTKILKICRTSYLRRIQREGRRKHLSHLLWKPGLSR